MSLKALALSTVALFMAAPLSAQDRAALRAEAFVASDVVTFGDLVDFAGSQALVPLFRAPALGSVGTIRAENMDEPCPHFFDTNEATTLTTLAGYEVTT